MWGLGCRWRWVWVFYVFVQMKNMGVFLKCYYFFKVTFCLFQFGGAAKMYDGNCHLNANQSYNPADKIYVSQLYLYCCLAIFQVCCNVIDEMFAVAFCFIYWVFLCLLLLSLWGCHGVNGVVLMSHLRVFIIYCVIVKHEDHTD